MKVWKWTERLQLSRARENGRSETIYKVIEDCLTSNLSLVREEKALYISLLMREN